MRPVVRAGQASEGGEKPRVGGRRYRRSGRSLLPRNRPRWVPLHDVPSVISRSMSDRAPALTSLDELRNFVHQTLCAKENLLPEQSLLRESPLWRDGQECGRQFIVQGPRLVQLSAIWAADQGLLYFYDTKGERFLKLHLSGGETATSTSPQRVAS